MEGQGSDEETDGLFTLNQAQANSTFTEEGMDMEGVGTRLRLTLMHIHIKIEGC